MRPFKRLLCESSKKLPISNGCLTACTAFTWALLMQVGYANGGAHPPQNTATTLLEDHWVIFHGPRRFIHVNPNHMSPIDRSGMAD